jgi:hypothetical protein
MSRFDHTTKEGREAMAAASNAAAVKAKAEIAARSAKPAFDFFAWFDNVEAEAGATEVGKIMAANGYTVSHTGGGCLCWERTLADGHYLWICDLGNGLGTHPNEEYLVGVYNADGAFDNESASNLGAALAWCAKRATDPARFIAEYQGRN